MRTELADTLIRAAEIVGVRKARGNRTAMTVTACALGLVAIGTLYRMVRRRGDPSEMLTTPSTGTGRVSYGGPLRRQLLGQG